MARRLFFVDEVRRDHAEIRGEDAHHLTRVLRVERGQRYEISDNSSLYLAEVETAHKELVTFRVVQLLEDRPPVVRSILLCALIKFDRFEFVLEKATELGVARIVPVETERTEKGLAQAARKRMDRWKKILIESSQQSRRVRLPRINEVVGLEEALAEPADVRLMLDEKPDAQPILRAIAKAPAGAESVALLIGPEGGWAERERTAVFDEQWAMVSLGPTVLRAETACTAALAVVNAAWQNR